MTTNANDINDLGAFGEAILQGRRVLASMAMIENEIYLGNIEATDGTTQLAVLKVLLADTRDLVESIGRAIDAIKD